jgi:hypothetical protein
MQKEFCVTGDSYQATAEEVAETPNLVEQSPLYAVGALLERIDYRGRAAASALGESCLAPNAGLQGPCFHGSTRSIEVFATQTLFVRESSFSQLLQPPSNEIGIHHSTNMQSPYE